MNALFAAAVALVALAGVAGYRIYRGPTLYDRAVAANAVGTTTVVVIALLAAVLAEPGLLDVALAYALLNFLLAIGLARYAGGPA
ncbi:monovalent cation/H+ antiporter complex subunit F [Halomicrococcus sp. NG-SE-24]|uniref:monovalent cation/H+ antiporter complex subunit F n=1 Tax=unclassified Halomicrococcus TaxID=2614448 RepID=UPI003D961BF9